MTLRLQFTEGVEDYKTVKKVCQGREGWRDGGREGGIAAKNKSMFLVPYMEKEKT